MLNSLTVGDPYSLVVVFLGLVALVLNVLQMIKREQNYIGLITGVIAAIFFIGMVGSIASFTRMANALIVVEEGKTGFIIAGTRVALVVVQLGALVAAANGLLCGVGHWLRKRR